MPSCAKAAIDRIELELAELEHEKAKLVLLKSKGWQLSGEADVEALRRRWSVEKGLKQRCANRFAALQPAIPSADSRAGSKHSPKKRPLVLVADSHVLTSSRSRFCGGGLCLRPKTSAGCNFIPPIASDTAPNQFTCSSSQHQRVGGMGKGSGTLLLLPVLAGASRPTTVSGSQSMTP